MIVVGVLLGVAAAFGLFFAGMYAADVSDYIHDTKQVPTLYEFYGEYNSSDEISVFFLGNSMVGFSVYPPEINRILLSKGYDISVYNLQMSGGSYREYILQLDDLIRASPDLVVIGVTYVCLGNESSNDYTTERFSLFYNASYVHSDTVKFFSDEDLHLISTSPDFFYYKKYIKNAFLSKIGFDLHYTNNYFVDPIGYNYRVEFDNSAVDERGINDAVSRYPEWHRNITEDNTIGRDALNYLVHLLRTEGIPVICVSLPLHPGHSENVTEVSRWNYHNYLNSTGVPWYDLERGYNASLFRDHAHMSFRGAMAISPAYANIIIEEVKSGAVHYT